MTHTTDTRHDSLSYAAVRGDATTAPAEVRALLADLESTLPAIVERSRVGELTGGLIHPATLANCDSAGHGPAPVICLGRKRAYPRRAFLDWLARRLTVRHTPTPPAGASQRHIRHRSTE